jgi:lactate dehydrogenase-like 2-hydroxyacid dehydrogenase
MARCLVTNELPGSGIDRLRAVHEVELTPLDGADLTEVEGLLSLLTEPVTADVIAAAPRLVAISNYAVGTDNVDLAAASARGIPVGHTPGVLTDSTADIAVGLMLAAGRRFSEGERLVRAGEWPPWEPDVLVGHDLHGSTVGIVGAGRIGRTVERRLEAFDCEVIFAGHERASLDRVLADSDFVSLHCPLTEETRHLIGEAELHAMRDTAYLVNTARGPIVDTAALERALREGWIAGAGLDVTDPEPLPGDHPLLGAPNLTVLPHLGSATHRTREAMADLAVDNLLAGLAGERMPHCANPDVYA